MSDPKALPGFCSGDNIHIGPYVRHLSKSIRLSIDEALDREFSAAGETRLTSVQAHVMGYLNMQDELGNVVYQKDIEQVFHIQRSTATGILKLLEQRGSIRRESEETPPLPLAFIASRSAVMPSRVKAPYIQYQ